MLSVGCIKVSSDFTSREDLSTQPARLGNTWVTGRLEINTNSIHEYKNVTHATHYFHCILRPNMEYHPVFRRMQQQYHEKSYAAQCRQLAVSVDTKNSVPLLLNILNTSFINQCFNIYAWVNCQSWRFSIWISTKTRFIRNHELNWVIFVCKERAENVAWTGTYTSYLLHPVQAC